MIFFVAVVIVWLKLIMSLRGLATIIINKTTLIWGHFLCVLWLLFFLVFRLLWLLTVRLNLLHLLWLGQDLRLPLRLGRLILCLKLLFLVLICGFRLLLIICLRVLLCYLVLFNLNFFPAFMSPPFSFLYIWCVKGRLLLVLASSIIVLLSASLFIFLTVLRWSWLGLLLIVGIALLLIIRISLVWRLWLGINARLLLIVFHFCGFIN
jgi:hypothetical protein